jgi:AbrB family looped-hinge helix DNA binding protein
LTFAKFFLKLAKKGGEFVEAVIDKFGRVLLPKKIRKTFGLKPGAVLTIQEDAKGVRLKLVEEKARVFEKKGVLVFSGVPTGDISETLAEVRNQRSKKVFNPS